MGQEITHSHFKKIDFLHYRNLLEAEMEILASWFKQQHQQTQHGEIVNSNNSLKAGFEIEACLVTDSGEPASINNEFIELLNNHQVTPELAKFNFELNSSVFQLAGNSLSLMHQELQRLWHLCHLAAKQLDHRIIMVGILPGLMEHHLNLSNMSTMKRYQALNEQVLRSRKGRAIELDIQGSETLRSVHSDVMLESTATSFQLHLQIPFFRASRYYNAAIILSAPLVALAANSPYLFGRELWCETRIPVFEQAVAVGGFEGAVFGPVKRVTFGSGYVLNSLLECFQENIDHYPILLPEIFDTRPEELAHLSLHNGTIWRWNRPLIGIDKSGDYHLRLEHRVLPAGPGVVDSVANAAFYYGTLTALANRYQPPENQLPFVTAKANFYHAAKQGLKARLTWFDQQQIPMKPLFNEYLIPMAKDGLNLLGIVREDIDYYMEIIEQRIATGQNGAVWQRNFVKKHGKDMVKLTHYYFKHQQSGQPVHLWPI